MINLYKNYIAKEDEKKKIQQILKLNEIKNEQEKQKKFSFSNIFDNNKHIELENDKINNLSTVEHKKTIFRKIANKIKKMFHIN